MRGTPRIRILVPREPREPKEPEQGSVTMNTRTTTPGPPLKPMSEASKHRSVTMTNGKSAQQRPGTPRPFHPYGRSGHHNDHRLRLLHGTTTRITPPVTTEGSVTCTTTGPLPKIDWSLLPAVVDRKEEAVEWTSSEDTMAPHRSPSLPFVLGLSPSHHYASPVTASPTTSAMHLSSSSRPESPISPSQESMNLSQESSSLSTSTHTIVKSEADALFVSSPLSLSPTPTDTSKVTYYVVFFYTTDPPVSVQRRLVDTKQFSTYEGALMEQQLWVSQSPCHSVSVVRTNNYLTAQAMVRPPDYPIRETVEVNMDVVCNPPDTNEEIITKKSSHSMTWSLTWEMNLGMSDRRETLLIASDVKEQMERKMEESTLNACIRAMIDIQNATMRRFNGTIRFLTTQTMVFDVLQDICVCLHTFKQLTNKEDTKSAFSDRPLVQRHADLISVLLRVYVLLCRQSVTLEARLKR